MKFNFLAPLDHLWVAILGFLLFVRAIFSLVDMNNGAKKIIVWTLVLLIGLALVLGSAIASNL